MGQCPLVGFEESLQAIQPLLYSRNDDEDVVTYKKQRKHKFSSDSESHQDRRKSYMERLSADVCSPCVVSKPVYIQENDDFFTFGKEHNLNGDTSSTEDGRHNLVNDLNVVKHSTEDEHANSDAKINLSTKSFGPEREENVIESQFGNKKNADFYDVSVQSEHATQNVEKLDVKKDITKRTDDRECISSNKKAGERISLNYGEGTMYGCVQDETKSNIAPSSIRGRLSEIDNSFIGNGAGHPIIFLKVPQHHDSSIASSMSMNSQSISTMRDNSDIFRDIAKKESNSESFANPYIPLINSGLKSHPSSKDTNHKKCIDETSLNDQSGSKRLEHQEKTMKQYFNQECMDGQTCSENQNKVIRENMINEENKDREQRGKQGQESVVPQNDDASDSNQNAQMGDDEKEDFNFSTAFSPESDDECSDVEDYQNRNKDTHKNMHTIAETHSHADQNSSAISLLSSNHSLKDVENESWVDLIPSASASSNDHNEFVLKHYNQVDCLSKESNNDAYCANRKDSRSSRSSTSPTSSISEPSKATGAGKRIFDNMNLDELYNSEFQHPQIVAIGSESSFPSSHLSTTKKTLEQLADNHSELKTLSQKSNSFSERNGEDRVRETNFDDESNEERTKEELTSSTYVSSEEDEDSNNPCESFASYCNDGIAEFEQKTDIGKQQNSSAIKLTLSSSSTQSQPPLVPNSGKSVKVMTDWDSTRTEKKERRVSRCDKKLTSKEVIPISTRFISKRTAKLLQQIPPPPPPPGLPPSRDISSNQSIHSKESVKNVGINKMQSCLDGPSDHNETAKFREKERIQFESSPLQAVNDTCERDSQRCTINDGLAQVTKTEEGSADNFEQSEQYVAQHEQENKSVEETVHLQQKDPIISKESKMPLPGTCSSEERKVCATVRKNHNHKVCIENLDVKKVASFESSVHDRTSSYLSPVEDDDNYLSDSAESNVFSPIFQPSELASSANGCTNIEEATQEITSKETRSTCVVIPRSRVQKIDSTHERSAMNAKTQLKVNNNSAFLPRFVIKNEENVFAKVNSFTTVSSKGEVALKETLISEQDWHEREMLYSPTIDDSIPHDKCTAKSIETIEEKQNHDKDHSQQENTNLSFFAKTQNATYIVPSSECFNEIRPMITNVGEDLSEKKITEQDLHRRKDQIESGSVNSSSNLASSKVDSFDNKNIHASIDELRFKDGNYSSKIASDEMFCEGDECTRSDELPNVYPYDKNRKDIESLSIQENDKVHETDSTNNNEECIFFPFKGGGEDCIKIEKPDCITSYQRSSVSRSMCRNYSEEPPSLSGNDLGKCLLLPKLHHKPAEDETRKERADTLQKLLSTFEDLHSDNMGLTEKNSSEDKCDADGVIPPLDSCLPEKILCSDDYLHDDKSSLSSMNDDVAISAKETQKVLPSVMETKQTDSIENNYRNDLQVVTSATKQSLVERSVTTPRSKCNKPLSLLMSESTISTISTSTAAVSKIHDITDNNPPKCKKSMRFSPENHKDVHDQFDVRTPDSRSSFRSTSSQGTDRSMQTRRLLEDVKNALSAIHSKKLNRDSPINEVSTPSSIRSLSSQGTDRTAQSRLLLEEVQSVLSSVKLQTPKTDGSNFFQTPPRSITEKNKLNSGGKIKGIKMLERCQDIMKNEEASCRMLNEMKESDKDENKSASNENTNRLISPSQNLQSINHAQEIMNRYGSVNENKTRQPKSSISVGKSHSSQKASIQRAQNIMMKYGQFPNVETISHSSCNDKLPLTNDNTNDKLTFRKSGGLKIQTKDELRGNRAFITRRHKLINIAKRNHRKAQAEGIDLALEDMKVLNKIKLNADVDDDDETTVKKDIRDDVLESPRKKDDLLSCRRVQTKDMSKSEEPLISDKSKISATAKRKKFLEARRQRSSQRR